MNWIIVGCIAFILLTLFDANKHYHWHSALNLLFPLAIGILIWAAVSLGLNQAYYGNFQAYPLFYGLVLLGILEQFYALFFALPTKSTYVGLGPIPLVNTGLYGLCRHPGVWGFFAIGLGLTLATGSVLIAFASITWFLFDLLHIAVEDFIFFPLFIPGYLDYQKQVPFLFFGVKEIKRCLE